MIVFALIIALFVIWIVSIISFFFALPYGGFLIPGARINSVIGFINLFVLVGVPVLAVLLRGVRFLFKRNVMSPRMSAGLWSVWTVNLISLFFIATITSRHFSSGERESQAMTIELDAGDTLQLQLQENYNINPIIELDHIDLDRNKLYVSDIHLSILRSKNGKFEMETRKYSRGQSPEEAALLASEITYEISQYNNTLNIPSGFVIPEEGKYRAQSVDIILRVPDGQYIRIGKEVNQLLSTVDVHERGIAPWHHRGKVWKMGVEGLVCTECPESKVGDESYTFSDFDRLQIDGKMKVEIKQGEAFKVHLTGKEVYTRKVDLVQTKENLTISADFDDPGSPVRLFIEMPYLESVDLDRTDDVKISGFVQPKMNIKKESHHDLKAYVNIDSLQLILKDRTEFDIRGSGKYLKANLYDRSRLDAEHYTVDVADINTEQNSKASVAVVDTLRKSRNGGSRIDVDGDPKVVIDSQQ